VFELAVELFGLLVHLAADDGAGGAADGRADDGAARRGAGGPANHAADDGACTRADGGAAARVVAAGLAEAEEGEEDQRNRGQAGGVATHGRGGEGWGGGAPVRPPRRRRCPFNGASRISSSVPPLQFAVKRAVRALPAEKSEADGGRSRRAPQRIRVRRHREEPRSGEAG